MTKANGAPISLTDFVIAKRRENCRVCSLPEEMRSQLAGASRKKISRELVIEWLTANGHKILAEDIAGHVNGRHT